MGNLSRVLFILYFLTGSAISTAAAQEPESTGITDPNSTPRLYAIIQRCPSLADLVDLSENYKSHRDVRFNC